MTGRLATAVSLASTLLLAGHAGAAEWSKGAGLQVSSYYTDNICRSFADEQSKAVGTFTPSVNLTGSGARANMRLNAAAEYNTLAGSSLDCSQQGNAPRFENRETWVPRLSFQSELEAVENFLFLEANASASQNAINPFAAGGDDNINGTGNTNITYRWGAGFRVQRQYSEGWAVSARYNYNEQYNSFNRGLANSQEDRVELDVGMIPEASRFSVGISGQYSEVTFEENPPQPEFTNRLSRLQLRSALMLSSSWQLNSFYGVEDNVFLSTNDEIDGSYWDVGLRWAPNPRVTVNAGYGERFFGETPRFDISYRHKRSQLSASYSRDLQFPRNIRVAGTDPDDPFAPAPGLPGDPLPGDGDETFLGQSPVLNERFALRYAFTARLSSLSLGATDSQQTRASDGRQGSFFTASAVVTRKLTRSLTGDARVVWRKNDGNPAGDQGFTAQSLEARTFGIGVQQKLARSTSLALRYLYTDQTSNNQLNTFTENRVVLSLNYQFL